MEKALILFSGGLDSTVNLARALQKFSVPLVITFDYSQKALSGEVESSRAICKRYRLPHKVIKLNWFKGISSSALIKGRRPLPKVRAKNLDSRKGSKRSARAVWVPNRNGVFISIAAAFCEGLGAQRIVVGFNCEEAATFPDNSESFIKAANASLAYSCMKSVRVMSFTNKLIKEEIVKLGMKIDAPLDLIWPCYGGGKRLCLRCESCVRCKRAFEKAGYWSWFKDHNRYMGQSDGKIYS